MGVKITKALRVEAQMYLDLCERARAVGVDPALPSEDETVVELTRRILRAEKPMRIAAKALAQDVCEIVGGRNSSAHVGTWINRGGVQLEVLLASKSDGIRIIVHKWNDEETCSVRLVKGDAWRRPDEFVQFWQIDGVTYDAQAIAEARDRADVFV